MNLSARQHRILADMGISVWARRDVPPVLAPAQETVISETPDTAAVDITGDIIVVMMTSQLWQDESRLFNAMLKAASLNPSLLTILDKEAFSSLSADALAGKTSLILGAELATVFLPDADLHQPQISQGEKGMMIASFSLADLLKQPTLKAAAWQALKQLKHAH